MLGIQAQGSFYLGNSPIKMEYSAYVSNGLNLTPATAGAPNINELANLENMESTFATVTNELAVGGRVGFWWPECGLEGVRSAHSVKIKQLSRRLGLLWPVRWFARPRVDDSSVSADRRPEPLRTATHTNLRITSPPAMLHFIPDSPEPLREHHFATSASVTPLPIGKPLRLYSLYFISMALCIRR